MEADAGTEEFDARFLSIKVQTPKGLKLSSDPVHAWAVSAALIRGLCAKHARSRHVDREAPRLPHWPHAPHPLLTPRAFNFSLQILRNSFHLELGIASQIAGFLLCDPIIHRLHPSLDAIHKLLLCELILLNLNLFARLILV